jgi:hypothetical protein
VHDRGENPGGEARGQKDRASSLDRVNWRFSDHTLIIGPDPVATQVGSPQDLELPVIGLLVIGFWLPRNDAAGFDGHSVANPLRVDDFEILQR